MFFENLAFIKGSLVLIGMAITFKFCLGVVTVAMLIIAYLKIKIISNQSGIETWE